MSKLEKDVRDIAEYLGCNADELWSEIDKLFQKYEAQPSNIRELGLKIHIDEVVRENEEMRQIFRRIHEYGKPDEEYQNI